MALRGDLISFQGVVLVYFKRITSRGTTRPVLSSQPDKRISSPVWINCESGSSDIVEFRVPIGRGRGRSLRKADIRANPLVSRAPLADIAFAATNMDKSIF
jgi:hypothetical protein